MILLIFVALSSFIDVLCAGEFSCENMEYNQYCNLTLTRESSKIQCSDDNAKDTLKICKPIFIGTSRILFNANSSQGSCCFICDTSRGYYSVKTKCMCSDREVVNVSTNAYCIRNGVAAAYWSCKTG
ncbi:MAG: hypothetical protein EZS28_056644, partial [Streblomastix strix]